MIPLIRRCGTGPVVSLSACHTLRSSAKRNHWENSCIRMAFREVSFLTVGRCRGYSPAGGSGKRASSRPPAFLAFEVPAPEVSITLLPVFMRNRGISKGQCPSLRKGLLWVAYVLLMVILLLSVCVCIRILPPLWGKPVFLAVENFQLLPSVKPLGVCSTTNLNNSLILNSVVSLASARPQKISLRLRIVPLHGNL